MSAESPDQEHIRAAMAGDRDAFRALVVAHQSNVRGLLLRLTAFDAARADDLAQDTFIRLFSRISSFRFEASFKSWLYRLAYNVFLDDQRRYAKQTEEYSIDEEAFFPQADEKLDLQKVLKRALAALKESERTAIVLTSIEELSHDEAASAMNLPLGTLKSHISRGKEKMRSVFIRHGAEVSL